MPHVTVLLMETVKARKGKSKTEPQVGPPQAPCKRSRFKVNIELDMVSTLLLLGALATRMYQLDQPRSIV